MLHQLSKPAGPNDAQVGFVPYGISVVTLFIFLFFTPAGLASMYLVISGAARAISAVVDDPRGDPLISLAHWIGTTAWTRNRDERQKIARERQEGADAPDVLRTGDWAELHGVDYVVLSARRKPDWHAGAIVLFVAGAGVAWLTFPHALSFLTAVGGPTLSQIYSPTNYLSLIILLMVAFGVAPRR